MDHYFHHLLIVLGVMLNWRDRPALALASVVGFSALFPVLSFVDTAWQFYTVCGLVDGLVGLLALWLRTRAGGYVASVCGALVVFHILGWQLNGYLPNSPYRVLVKIAEYAQLIACVSLSNPFLGFLKNAARNRASPARTR